MSQRLLLRVAYEGTDFSGFVPQSNATTVGQLLQDAIWSIDANASKLTCASRTDAGVHAADQVASCVVDKTLSSRGWTLALNQRLPDSIAVRSVGFVPLDFDPRRDPTSKTYRYRVLADAVRDPYWARTCWRVGQRLDVESMTREARALLGEHDFAAFRQARDERTSTTRRLSEVFIEQHGSSRVDIVVTGNRFLYNMVRIIAGTLVDVARGRCAAGATTEALQTGDRQRLGMTAPAHGLCLERVVLATEAKDRWPALAG